MQRINDQYAYLGHQLVAELIKRHQSGHAASAEFLAKSVQALLIAKKPQRFREFISEIKS